MACRWDQLSLAYTEPRGLPELREEVAKLYHGVSADEVLILAPQEAISIAMLAILRPGDHVVVAFPGYQSLYAIARTVGAEISFWHMRTDEEGGLGFQVCCCMSSALLGRRRIYIASFVDPHYSCCDTHLSAVPLAGGEACGTPDSP